ncbi:MAG: hypothetical protein ACLSH6_08325 [Limosilactobacillus pontis]
MISGMTPQQRQAEKKYTTFLYDRPMEAEPGPQQQWSLRINDAGTTDPFGKLITTSQIRQSAEHRRGDEGLPEVRRRLHRRLRQAFLQAILYSFTAPFLWELAEGQLEPRDGNDVPNFLLLRGAGSGKSTLLRIINQ